jgi:hypothetical protein
VTTDDDEMTTRDDARGLDVIAVVAIQVVVAVAVWGLAGLLVDLVLGTGPWLQFTGVIVGTMIALALAQRLALGPTDGKASHG